MSFETTAKKLCRYAACGAVLIALAAAPAMMPGSARAQQGRSTPAPLVLPRNQGQGSTLELPTVPGRQGGTANIPSQIPVPRQQLQPQQPEQQELTIPSRQLREQPGYEQVQVTVTDRNGGYVTGLQKDDFKLYLDGQHRPIEFFRQDLNTPVSIGILVDTSGSMVPKLRQAQFAIFNFIKELNPRDDVFLIAFSGRPYMLQSFTTNHQLVIEKLKYLHPEGETALFDAVDTGLRRLQSGRYDKKALLVITDGVDNESRATVNDIVSEAKRQGVLVYSIGIGDPNASPASLQIGPFVIGGMAEKVDAETLHTLSNETGAKTFIIREVGDGGLLRSDCEQISRELREQYTVGFVAPDPSSGGYRSVKVESPTHPGDEVRVRKGVEVGGPSAYAADPGTSAVP